MKATRRIDQFNPRWRTNHADDAQIHGSGRKVEPSNQGWFAEENLGISNDFGPLEGKRAAMIFFDMAESSKIVEICEELFSSLDAEVEFIPVMNADELGKGLANSGL